MLKSFVCQQPKQPFWLTWRWTWRRAFSFSLPGEEWSLMDGRSGLAHWQASPFSFSSELIIDAILKAQEGRVLQINQSTEGGVKELSVLQRENNDMRVIYINIINIDTGEHLI